MRIGILDSGLGGLTVASEIADKFPNLEIHYIGDTARIPYGTRTPETVRIFAAELFSYLNRQNIEALVIACNTISAVAYEEMLETCPVPIIDVIRPTVYEATKKKAKDIAVIGTRATINSNIYRTLIHQISPKTRVREVACPLFVPIVEEGFAHKDIATAVIMDQLKEFISKPPEIIILGCTHYPYLRDKIQHVLPNTFVLDSAKPTTAILSSIVNLSPSKQAKKAKIHITLTMESAAIKHLLPKSLKDAMFHIISVDNLKFPLGTIK